MLAAQVRMSRSAFAARFAELVGQAPLAYLIHRRMWLAAELLRTQSLGLSEVAERVGYDSKAAFSRTFKKHMGIAPGQYRRGETRRGQNANANRLSEADAPESNGAFKRSLAMGRMP